MTALKYTLKTAGIFAAGALAFSVPAHALTLDTTFVQANSVFSLSELGQVALDLTGTTISAVGNASNAGTQTSADGIVMPAFNLPVTKVDVSLGLPPFSPLVSPNSGEAMGSALSITRGSQSVTLANFVIDYSHDLVMADITSKGVTIKNTSLYSFDATDLKIGLNGLTLNMHQQLNNLTFTSSALNSFASGLNLSAFMVAPLASLNFGSITIDINGALRMPIDASPYKVASVPEAPPLLMMGLGLFGIAFVARRKLRH